MDEAEWEQQVAATWASADELSEADLLAAIEGLAAWYLSQEWEQGYALDPVARFHLGNGARLERINWAADTSAKGLAQSFGLMVNYVYDLGDVERNHEDYVNRHRVVASSAVEKLARGVESLVAPAPVAT